MNLSRLLVPYTVAMLTGLVSVFSANAQRAHKYTNPTQNEFPIMAYHAGYSREMPKEYYEEMRQAGINLAIPDCKNFDELLLSLKNSKGTGVKIIASCGGFDSDPEGVAKRIRNSRSLGGYFHVDEPSADKFDGIGAWTARLRKIDDRHLLYNNLFPDYANTEMLQADSYEDYVREYCKTSQTGFVSFDFYPIVNDNGNVYIRDTYYENLEIVRKVCKEFGFPFWGFALSTPHEIYPLPTSEHLRLQAFSNLAYGAQGMEYFTYLCSGDRGPISYTTRQRTEIWDLVGDLNKEIQALSEIFLGAEVLDVSHTGKIPYGAKALSLLPAPFKEIRQNGGEGLLVSHLRNGDWHYLMIVNRDLHNRQEVIVQKDSTVERILRDGTSVRADRYMPDLWLMPGDYLLFRWKQHD